MPENEPHEEPKPTKPEESRVAKFYDDYLKQYAGFGFIAAFVGIAYTVGSQRAEMGVTERVEREKNEGVLKLVEAKKESAQKEQELRQCLQQASALSAVVALNQSDRERLLALTTTEPSLKVTLDGRPLVGRVTAQLLSRAGVEGAGCYEIKFWVENTGRRDIRVEGLEWITPAGWYTESNGRIGMSPTDTTESEGDATHNRHWLGLEVNLPPAGRRYVHFDFCGPDRSELPTTLTVNASGGFLPLTFKWTLVPKT